MLYRSLGNFILHKFSYTDESILYEKEPTCSTRIIYYWADLYENTLNENKQYEIILI